MSDRDTEHELLFLESIVENIPNMIFVKEAKELRFVRFNRAGEELLGYDRSELIGRNDYDFFPKEEADLFTAKDREVLAGTEVLDVPEEPIHTRCKGERWLHTQKIPIRDESGKAIYLLGISEDITERKAAREELQATRERLAAEKMQARLLEAQKLESMAVLAGGVAHDFNNLLVGILGNASLALSEIPRGSRSFACVERIQAAAAAASDLTRQMLAYSGKGRFVVEPIDLSALVEELAALLEVSVGQNGALITDLGDVPLVEADASQMRQIVLNLITNASEALADRPGEVRLRTYAVDADEAYFEPLQASEPLEPGCYVVIEVSDTGIGMPPETLKRMFDPFFTTKDTGHGLGLAATLGIVRGHRGAISVQSRPGEGTTVKIVLPSCDSVAPVKVSSQSIQGDIGGTVLVIDDQPVVREFVGQALRFNGFTVRLASDGVEGLARFREDPASIDLVLLDLTMPRMNGDEVFRELRLLDPDVKVLLSSGYSEQQTNARFAGEGAPAGFLQKPYTADELIARVRELVNPRQAP